VLIGFGIVGWIMKRLGWPRPPMVLGIVIGGIFERYLYISTSLYGSAWLLRPVVIVILCLVGWALFKPLSEIVASVVREIREMKRHQLRFGASAAFTLAIIAFIIAAIALSSDWPAAAKPVPLTACYMALTAAGLNLINELFGKEQSPAARGNVDGGVAVRHVEIGVEAATARRQSTVYFAWLLAFLLTIWLIGFIPAIAIFVFAYMCLGFGEPALQSAGFAAGTALLCWGLFDRVLAVSWPASLLGDLFPHLRELVGFV
jgi:putative tricarboxylic transport membrane protein